MLLATMCRAQRCQNNSDVKYELAEEAEIVGYHSACSEFTGRTCCSVNNLDALRKKYDRRDLEYQNTS